VPDVDHGGVLQMALQLMLMQTDEDRIRLLPAWPTEWDVDFKLHAPGQTTVEASIRDGRVVQMRVDGSDSVSPRVMVESAFKKPAPD
jgi:hypothetical protein